ncbi:TIM-barrel domain-containing protein [Moorellaceae bacterium AZ2]
MYTYTLEQGNFTVQIEGEPFRLSFVSYDGQEITAGVTSLGGGFLYRHQNEATQWHRLVRATKMEAITGGKRVTCVTDAGSEAFIDAVSLKDNVVEIRLTVPHEPVCLIGMHLFLHEDDHFYGLGERFNALDQRGEAGEFWVTNCACGRYTYKPVPFMMTPRGYGLALQGSRRYTYRLGTPEEPHILSLWNPSNEFSFQFIYGPELRKILELYSELVGRPPLPPAWVFAPWKSRDWRVENQSTVYEDLHTQRQLGLAAGVKLIDAGWETEYHSFVFDKRKYPEAEKMLSEAREMGYRVVLWLSPWMVEGTEAYNNARRLGYFVRRADGEVYVHQLSNNPGLKGSLLDFTNPAVCNWWQDKIRTLMEMGVSGFKTDFGEQVPEDAVFHDGRTGAEMHNLYPVLYNRTTWEVVKQYGGILLARSAWAGSQQYGAIWAGDQTADFCPWSGLPSVARAALSAGLSGFPFWGCDIGGYFGAPEPEVFIRWLQFGAFSPIMQVHGLGEHDPWHLGAEVLSIYRHYANLHTRLFPYFYAYAAVASERGLPIMRSLVLHYQEDKNLYKLWSADYEYLLGDYLLVAPLFFGGAGREIYLPAGQWVDWWTGKRYEGPICLQYSAPLTVTPAFIRAGAIIPLLEDGLDVPLVTSAPGIKGTQGELTLEVYPGEQSSITLQDGTILEQRPTDGGLELRISNNGTYKSFVVNLFGARDAEIVRVDGAVLKTTGQALPVTATIAAGLWQENGQGWMMMPEAREISLKIRLEIR